MRGLQFTTAFGAALCTMCVLPRSSMMKHRRLIRSALLLAALTGTAALATAATLDESAPPGASYDKAEFRFWYPDAAGPLRAIVVLVPGSNGDGRPQVDEPFWQE